MFKKIFFQLHWFFGITAGLILALMGVTGAIYSYEQQILKWMNPDSYVVTVQQQAPLSPAELYQRYQTQFPDAQINSVTVASAADEAAVINIVKEGQRRGYNEMVNPYTAEVLPAVKGREFFQFIQQLHRNLTVGPVGKQITGACTLILIFFVLSGLYLRWPKRHTWRQWLAIKPKLKGRNFLWDLHAVVGTWVAIFYLVLACTGLYWSYDWWRSGMYKVLGVERPQPTEQAQKGPRGGEGGGEGRSAEHGEQRARQSSAGERHAAGGEHARGEGHGAGRGESRGEGRIEARVSPSYVYESLKATWAVFPTQLNRDYTTMTFNLPKQQDGILSISFTDKPVQHERARNNAEFNLKTQQIEKLELYEAKKLNEKIMSSMLPVHRGSFFGPVYQFFVMLAALSMPLFFVTGWMLYLKRRKQKRLTQAAKVDLSTVRIDENATPWLIAYASQTGVSEQLAWHTAASLQQAGQPVQVRAFQQLTLEELAAAPQVLWIASTYGTGQAPDLASAFAKKLFQTELNLSNMRYAVLALGSKEYPDSYCQFGHALDQALANKGATRLFDTIEVDNANKADIEHWHSQLAQVTELELHSLHIEKTFDDWMLTKRELLNPGSLGDPAYHLELTTQGDVSWHSGDIAEIQPGNSTARIEAFLTAHGFITDLSAYTASLQQQLRYKNLSQVPADFDTLEDLLAQLPTLPSREYSIASIPSQQVLRLVVRQSHKGGELGLGSGWLTEHAELHQPIQLRIRTNPSFHLAQDNRPMLFIGNGTGIAGLMSHLHARTRAGHGNNWLIFGERQRTKDFLFQNTIEAWQSTGILTHLDLAFSRDQDQRVYVQDKLREQAARLVEWVNQGASIYVCGSIDGMASGVEDTLIDLLGEAQVQQLREQGRYLRDVY